MHLKSGYRELDGSGFEPVTPYFEEPDILRAEFNILDHRLTRYNTTLPDVVSITGYSLTIDDRVLLSGSAQWSLTSDDSFSFSLQLMPDEAEEVRSAMFT